MYLKTTVLRDKQTKIKTMKQFLSGLCHAFMSHTAPETQYACMYTTYKASVSWININSHGEESCGKKFGLKIAPETFKLGHCCSGLAHSLSLARHVTFLAERFTYIYIYIYIGCRDRISCSNSHFSCLFV